MTSSCFRIELHLHGLIIVFNFEFFQLVEDLQGIKDSTDTFSLTEKFPLMKLFKRSTMLPLLFFLFFVSNCGLWFPINGVFTYNLAKVFILDYLLISNDNVPRMLI